MKICNSQCADSSVVYRHFLSGFSYIWLLALISLLGLSLALASEIWVTAVQRDKERELLAIGHQFRQAIASYYESQAANVLSNSIQSNNSPTVAAISRQYPSSLDHLLMDERTLTNKRHLRKIFVDPMTGKNDWGLYKQEGRIVGVYSLSEKQPIKIDGFDAQDASLRDKKKYSEWIFAYPPDAVERASGSLSSSQNSSVIAPSPALLAPAQNRKEN
jgi:type II secretory pathway pseudopilin PulG